jgi:hypothetical protein
VKLEARLFQAQKMETIGKPAGGVANEFNSILTAIIGQSELLLGDLPPKSPLVNSASDYEHRPERHRGNARRRQAHARAAL